MGGIVRKYSKNQASKEFLDAFAMKNALVLGFIPRRFA